MLHKVSRIVAFIVILGGISLLAGCFCLHKWDGATCYGPRACHLCGLTEGSPLEHDWIPATCTTSKVCSLCRRKAGDPLGHTPGDWQITQDATENTPGTRAQFCSVCYEVIQTEPFSLLLEPIAGNIAQICSSFSHVAVLRTDGTVAAVGENSQGQCNVESWRNVIQVYTTNDGTIGLKADGTVVSTFFDTTGWTEIKELLANRNYSFVVGLKKDGKVVVYSTDETDYSDVFSWTNITDIKISPSSEAIIGIRDDGTVATAGMWHNTLDDTFPCPHCIVKEWTDIERVFIVSSDGSTIGYKTDGSIISSDPKRFNVDSWGDVVFTAHGYSCDFGLTSDGALLTEGDEEVWTDGSFIYTTSLKYNESWEKKLNVSQFTDLETLVIWSPRETGYLFGLKSNGNVVQAAGRNPFDLSDWRNIKILKDFDYTLVGIRENGTVVAVGAEGEDAFEVCQWEGIVDIVDVSWDGGCGYSHGYIGVMTDGSLIGTSSLDGLDLAALTQ